MRYHPVAETLLGAATASNDQRSAGRWKGNVGLYLAASHPRPPSGR